MPDCHRRIVLASQEEVAEVRHGMECGIGIGTYSGLKAGDTVECFTIVETPQTLE